MDCARAARSHLAHRTSGSLSERSEAGPCPESSRAPTTGSQSRSSGRGTSSGRSPRAFELASRVRSASRLHSGPCH